MHELGYSGDSEYGDSKIYEKTIKTKEYKKILCIYKAYNTYLVKISKCPLDQEGIPKEDEKMVYYYTSDSDPTEALEGKRKESDKEKEKEPKSAIEAIRTYF